MKRRKFLLATAITLPAIGFTQALPEAQERSKKGFVVKANASRFNETTKLGGKSPNDIKVSAKDTNQNLAIFEYVGNEKGGPPLHVHLKQDEVFYIVEGEYLFQVGDEQFNLKAGDTIFLPRNVPHTFAQLTEKGKMFFLFQPAGKMEDFFRANAALSGPPSPEQGAKLFADHEMKVLGPPLKF